MGVATLRQCAELGPLHRGQGFGYGPELMGEMTFVKLVHLEPLPHAKSIFGNHPAGPCC